MKTFFTRYYKHLKYNKLFVAIILFSLSNLSLTSAQTLLKTKYSPKAVDLQTRAIKYQFNIKDSEKQTFNTMLKVLDSATKIEPNYGLAHRTKVIPLIKLKRYKEALIVLRKARSIDPTNLNDIIKQGVIWELYLNKPKESANLYKQAYDIAVENKNKGNIKNSYHDQTITYCLTFYKGKEEALRHLSSCYKNYNDKESINALQQLEKLIRSKPFNESMKKSILQGT